MTAKSKLLRMDNVLIVVDDLEAAKAFFAELGMQLDHGITFSVTARSSMLLDSTAYSDETGLPDTCRIRRVEQIRENPNMGRDALLLFVQKRTRSGFFLQPGSARRKNVATICLRKRSHKGRGDGKVCASSRPEMPWQAGLTR